MPVNAPEGWGIMEIKLLKKGIRIDGIYYSVWYSSSANSKGGYGVGNATIYCRNYDRLPAELNKLMDVQNDSEIQTDYIEKDRIRVSPGSIYFKQVEEFAKGKGK